MNFKMFVLLITVALNILSLKSIVNNNFHNINNNLIGYNGPYNTYGIGPGYYGVGYYDGRHYTLSY